MMKISFKISATLLLMAVAACGGSGKQEPAGVSNGVSEPAKAEKPFANVVFATNKDTSCGMPLSAGVEDTLHYKDKVYGFCSKECKDDFVNKLKAEKKL